MRARDDEHLPAAVRRTRRLRLGIGVLACLGLPAASWLEGSRAFAWTMYSRTGDFRIDLVSIDPSGQRHVRNPTLLADGASPGAAALLAGADHWRPGPSTAVLRDHLPELAAHACTATGAASIELTLHERPGGHERTTTTRRPCRT